MPFWNTVKNVALLEVIEWLDSTRDTLVFRFETYNKVIKDGAKLVVREGQAAVFINEGRMSDVFGPGTYDLDTRNARVMAWLKAIEYGFNAPYKGEIYFVNTRQYTEQKWGTANPIMMRDAQLGAVRIRAFGIYTFRVTDPGKFIKEIVGTQGLFTTNEINGQLKRKLVSGLADTIGESKIPVLELAAQYMDLGDAMRSRLTGWFEENYGITLTDFVVESISLPPEVEKMLDKRTSMGLLGDMNSFTQFQAANAIEAAASQPGGANPMLNAGMGLAMGGVMGAQMMGAQQGSGQFNPQTGFPGTPPPPPAAQATYHYNGAGGTGQYGAAEIANLVAQNRAAPHNVWQNGWPGWKSWTEVPEIATKVPPPAAAGGTYHYHGPDGQAELGAQAIAAKVAANPGAKHSVWKQGFDGWKDAKDVPEIAAALGGGGPPPPPGGGGGPPPPPM